MALQVGLLRILSRAVHDTLSAVKAIALEA